MHALVAPCDWSAVATSCVRLKLLRDAVAMYLGRGFASFWVDVDSDGGSQDEGLAVTHVHFFA